MAEKTVLDQAKEIDQEIGRLLDHLAAKDSNPVISR